MLIYFIFSFYSKFLKNKVKTSGDRKLKNPLNNIICSECNRSFSKNCHLRRHMSVHNMEYEFVCKICQYRYASLKLLKKHRTTKHISGPYKCPDCPLVLEKHSDLVRHSVIHMEKQFKCDVCDKRFKTQATTTRHMHFKHPDVLPYKCQICDKAFRVESHLSDHINVHLGQKKHKCEMCERSKYKQKLNPFLIKLNQFIFLFRFLSRHGFERSHTYTYWRTPIFMYPLWQIL